MKINLSQLRGNPNLMDAFLSTKMDDCSAEPYNGRMYLMPHQFGPAYPELWSPSEDASITQELMEKHWIGAEYIPHQRVWSSHRPDGRYYREADTRLKAQLLCLVSYLSDLNEDGEVDRSDPYTGECEIPDALYHGLTKEN